jgi:hypothetical protein
METGGQRGGATATKSRGKGDERVWLSGVTNDIAEVEAISSDLFLVSLD